MKIDARKDRIDILQLFSGFNLNKIPFICYCYGERVRRVCSVKLLVIYLDYSRSEF